MRSQKGSRRPVREGGPGIFQVAFQVTTLCTGVSQAVALDREPLLQGRLRGCPVFVSSVTRPLLLCPLQVREEGRGQAEK
jgi:hypothetical protein